MEYWCFNIWVYRDTKSVWGEASATSTINKTWQPRCRKIKGLLWIKTVRGRKKNATHCELALGIIKPGDKSTYKSSGDKALVAFAMWTTVKHGSVDTFFILLDGNTSMMFDARRIQRTASSAILGTVPIGARMRMVMAGCAGWRRARNKGCLNGVYVATMGVFGTVREVNTHGYSERIRSLGLGGCHRTYFNDIEGDTERRLKSSVKRVLSCS